MISNPDRTVLLSSLGWADRDSVWRFDATTGKNDHFRLGTGARYLSLHSSGNDYFSVAHHFDGVRFEVTVHRFEKPKSVLARVSMDNRSSKKSGDVLMWTKVPRLYVEYLRFEPWKDYVLVEIDPSTGQAEVQCFKWYDDEIYDKGYQGIVAALELPGEDCALISVQRCSKLVLHDVKTGEQKGSIELCGRRGNPDLQIRNGGSEIWASDYDSIAVLNRDPWRVVRSALLQEEPGPNGRLFIGEYSFSRDESLCVVARPYSGDIVAVDAESLEIVKIAEVGRQPLEVAALDAGVIVSRDWKTGDLLLGKMS
jgi:hypothetical protein